MKPTILLLHGALCTSSQFESLIKRLKPYFDVHALDFSAHTHTPYDGVLDMNVLVKDIAQYFNNIAGQPCHIFGYSMGGYAAVTFAMGHPERLGKIMTLGTKWDWNPASSAKDVAMLDPSIMADKLPSYVVKLQSLFGENNWINVVEKTAELMLDLGHGTALVEDDFNNIDTDVLILRGSEDRMVTAESSEEVASWLKNGKYQEIAGFPHPLERVDIDVLAQEIIKFCG